MVALVAQGGAGVGVDEPTRESLAILAPALLGVPGGWHWVFFMGPVKRVAIVGLSSAITLAAFNALVSRLSFQAGPLRCRMAHKPHSTQRGHGGAWRWRIGTPVLSPAHGYCDGVDDCGKW